MYQLVQSLFNPEEEGHVFPYVQASIAQRIGLALEKQVDYFFLLS